MSTAKQGGSPQKNRAESPEANKRGGSPLRRSSTRTASMRASSPMMRLGSPEPEHRVKKNAKGGVLVTPEEIATAFGLLDVDKTGKLTLNGLKKRLGTLFPEMSAKEYRFLMNNKKELTIDDLKELLLENELTGFDPMFDAFKVFDPENRGSINEDKLRKAFISFGMGELSDEELEILRRTADLDNDGRVTLEDFRGMLEGQQKKPILPPTK